MARHAAVLLALAAFTLLAQPTKPAPTFDVASIHQTDRSAPPTPCFMRGQAGGQTYTGRCIALSVIIKRAYQIVDSQLSGGPDWLNTTLFDFDAKTDRPTTRADVEPLSSNPSSPVASISRSTPNSARCRRWFSRSMEPAIR
jgi:hypothetical protein